MRSVGRSHVLRRWALHEKWKWNEKGNNNTQNKECADKGKDARLGIHHLLKLREGVLARTGGASGVNGGLLQPCHKAVKKDIAGIEMGNEINATDLPMAGQIRNKKRNSNRTAQVAYEVADAGDLVIVLPAHADVRKRADRNED